VLDPIDLIDGIALEDLVAKRTTGLMQPHLAAGIEKSTRQQFPNGLAAYGTDALRFTFASLATLSRDIRFDVGRIEGYRNFCNKLWNAARYVLMTTEGQDLSAEGAELSLADRWVRSRLAHAVGSARAGIKDYRLDAHAQALYEFSWYEYCDWYLELSKAVLQSDTATEAQKRGTRLTLVEVLETTLRALHPLMPFITEEIWLRTAPALGMEATTIMRQPYPVAGARDEAAEAELGWVHQVVLGLRRIRGEMDIPPSKRFVVLVKDASPSELARLAANSRAIERLANTEPPQIVAPGAKLRVVRSEELPSEGSQVTAAAMPGEERQSELVLVSFGQIVAGEHFTTVPIAVA
jgi:valyl-tRNA synthetase